MTIKDLKNYIKYRLEFTKKEYNVSSWGYQPTDKMNSDEAYERGFYEALKRILKDLNYINNSNNQRSWFN